MYSRHWRTQAGVTVVQCVRNSEEWFPIDKTSCTKNLNICQNLPGSFQDLTSLTSSSAVEHSLELVWFHFRSGNLFS